MTIDKCDTKTLKYRVLGEAIPLGRVRAANIGGRIRTYTPQKSVEEKAAVRAIVQQAMAEQEWKVPSQDMPVKVELTIRCKCPLAKARWVHAAAAKGLIVPLSAKGDVDNVLKLYLDAMNEIVFPDDKQVYKAVVTREYLTEKDLEKGLGPYVECVVTGYYLNYGEIKVQCAQPTTHKSKRVAANKPKPTPDPAVKRKRGRPKKKKEGETNGNE